jgi:PAS domain S-box-containing protein
VPRRTSTPTTAAGLRRGAESRLSGHQKKPAPDQTAAGTRRQFHELEVHQIELEMQNAELLITRAELEAALAKYHYLYDFALVGYFSIDESGAILEANLTGAALVGVERSRIINRRLPLFVSPMHQPIFLAFLKDIFAGTRNLVCEVRVMKQGGGVFWADFRATSAISLQGDRPWCQIACGDITDRKRLTLLTTREMEVLQMVAEGKPNKVSGSELGISPRTVEKHRGHVMDKLHIHDTAGLTRYAISAGIIKSSV